MAFSYSYPHWTHKQSRAPSLRQGYTVLAIIGNMSPSDSPSWLTASFHRFTAYKSGYYRTSPVDQVGSLQFPDQLSQHSVSLTPEGSLALLQVPTMPSVAFAYFLQARLPLVPLRAKNNDAAEFTLCYRLLSCDDTASTLGLLLTPGGRYGTAWPLP